MQDQTTEQNAIKEVEIPFMYHQKKTQENGVIEISGHCTTQLKMGDVITLLWMQKEGRLKVVEVLENRSHNGNFKNPEDAKNSFWKLLCIDYPKPLAPYKASATPTAE